MDEIDEGLDDLAHLEQLVGHDAAVDAVHESLRGFAVVEQRRVAFTQQIEAQRMSRLLLSQNFGVFDRRFKLIQQEMRLDLNTKWIRKDEIIAFVMQMPFQ